MTAPTDPASHPTTCPEASRLHRYHDGELHDAGQRRDLEQHVRDCASCAAELAAMRGISRSFEAAAVPAMRSDFTDQLRHVIATQRDADAEAARWMQRLSYAMAAMLLIGIGLLALDPRRGSGAADSPAASTSTTPARAQLAQVTYQNYAEQTEPRSDSEQAVAFAQWVVDDLSATSILSTDEAMQ